MAEPSTHNVIHWLPVNGWEGIYEVSNFGDVRRIVSGGQGGIQAGHILAGRMGIYRQVRLRDKKRIEYQSVHVLVAEAFHGPRPPAGVVNHIDANKGNNRASNLEWTTAKGNSEHMALLGHVRQPGDLCRRGHPFVESNTLYQRNGQRLARRCKLCTRAREMRRRKLVAA